MKLVVIWKATEQQMYRPHNQLYVKNTIFKCICYLFDCFQVQGICVLVYVAVVKKQPGTDRKDSSFIWLIDNLNFFLQPELTTERRSPYTFTIFAFYNFFQKESVLAACIKRLFAVKVLS